MLGSNHDIPLELLLSQIAIEVIKEINNKGAILCLEHETSNVHFIHILNIKKVENANLLAEIKSCADIESQEFQSNYMEIKDKFIKINNEKEDSLQIHQLFDICPLWLAAPILAIHQGLITYNKYGGFY